MYPKKNQETRPGVPETPAWSPEQDGDGLDLRELLLKLKRRRGAMAGVFLLVMTAVVLFVFQAIPRYTAQTLMVLDLRQTHVVDIEAVLSGMPRDVAAIRSEIDILQSRTLLEKVARKLRLERDPEFNVALLDTGETPFYRSVLDWFTGFWVTAEEVAPKPNPEEQEALQFRSVVDRLSSGLKVENPRQSLTIALSFVAQTPNRAAEIVNTLAELYLTDQLEVQYDATRRANEWLAVRLDDLRVEVNTAELAVQSLRKRGQLVQARGVTVLEQQIAEFNAQLILARVARSQAEVRQRGAQEALARAGGVGSIAEVLASPIIQRLRSEESTLQRRVAEISQRFGPRHPEMIKINAELADIQRKMTEETNRVVESLTNEVEVARAKERALRSSLDEMRVQAGGALQAEVELRELERQAQSARVMYENFMQRHRETEAQQTLHRPDARIITWAAPPLDPSYPQKQSTLALGAMMGLMLSTMVAFLLEALDRGFRTGDQTEKATGIPVLGMIPDLPKRKGAPDEFILKKPLSALSEAIRAVRTAVHLANVDSPPKTLLFTSSLPSEGKSTLCLSMGRLAALSGTKTLLIEADLRRSPLSKRVQTDQDKAKLEEVLQRTAPWQDAIVQDKPSGLHLLLAHGKTPGSGELLGSQRMAGLLQELAAEYELIIIDTPPVLGVSDTWSLAKSVDSVIFLVHWAETPRETVNAALHQMKLLGVKVDGIVLSRVNIRQQAKYGYGGYGYYYGKYQKYYKEYGC